MACILDARKAPGVPMAAPAPFPPVIKHYRLARELGRGGMGVVVEGFDRRDDSRVAVKLLHPYLAMADETYRERFEREAHIGALLRSPYTVHLLDYGVEQQHYFIVMEFIEGTSLAEVIRDEGPLEPARALRIASEVARALEEAGARGVVHRDIKPENILVDRDGRVKVTDFGIARQETAAGLTGTGGFVGTAHYAAPEQSEGFADQRTDVYALGATLYCMLAGHPPYDGRSVTDILIQHRVASLPMAPLSHLPDPVQNLVRRCLEKDPLDRYQTASELVGALERARAALTRQPGAPPPRSGGSRAPAPVRTDDRTGYARRVLDEPSRPAEPTVAATPVPAPLQDEATAVAPTPPPAVPPAAVPPADATVAAPVPTAPPAAAPVEATVVAPTPPPAPPPVEATVVAPASAPPPPPAAPPAPATVVTPAPAQPPGEATVVAPATPPPAAGATVVAPTPPPPGTRTPGATAAAPVPPAPVSPAPAPGASAPPPVPPKKRPAWHYAAMAAAVLAVAAVVALLVVPRGDDGPAASGDTSPTPGETATATGTAAATGTPTATATTATATATSTPERLPTVYAPVSTVPLAQLFSGARADVVGQPGACTVEAWLQPTRSTTGQYASNRVAERLCTGDTVVVATNSPAASTFLLGEGLLWWRVLVEKSGNVLWVAEAAADGRDRQLTIVRRFDAPPPMTIDPKQYDYTARIYTEIGEVELKLNAAEAPVSVNNFVFLAERGFYNGLTFFRATADLLQGGDPVLDKGGGGDPGYQIRPDVNALRNSRGTVSWAQRGDGLAGSQFFINVADNRFLDADNPDRAGSFYPFATVTRGIEVIDEIVFKAARNGELLTPPFVIYRVTIERTPK
jgi:cyclophilin family peptidyl-prolyl cis-trans isomerase/predicted Ser/Thr protein kinase